MRDAQSLQHRPVSLQIGKKTKLIFVFDRLDKAHVAYTRRSVLGSEKPWRHHFANNVHSEHVERAYAIVIFKCLHVPQWTLYLAYYYCFAKHSRGEMFGVLPKFIAWDGEIASLATWNSKYTLSGSTTERSLSSSFELLTEQRWGRSWSMTKD